MILEPGDNQIFRSNLECISTLYPVFFKMLQRAPENAWPDNLLQFEFHEGKLGHPTFSVIAPDGRKILGHSLFDPVKEAEKKWADLELKEGERLVVLGFGFGYHLKYLLEKTSETKQFFIVIEPYPTLFREALKRVDFTKIFASRRMIPCVTVEPSELGFVISSGVSAATVPQMQTASLPYFNAVPGVTDRVQVALSNMKDNLLFNMFTALYAGHSMWQNVIENFIHAYRNPGVNAFVNVIKGRPAFVIAPGPSLEHNMEQLKRVKGKAAIIAVDTATRILLRKGIKPDIIVSIDYQKRNFEKLKGIDTSYAYLMPAVEVCSDIPANHNGKIISYYHSPYTAQIYDPILGQKGTVSSGGSVLTDAINIAMKLGADPIILMGVDLSFPGNRFYSEGSFENGDSTRALTEGKIQTQEVVDIYGNPVSTYKSFYAFLNYLDMLFQKGERTYIDATEGGANIKGSLTMTAEDAIDEFITEPYDVIPLLAEIHSKYEQPSAKAVLKKADKLLEKYKRLQKHAKRGVESSKKASKYVDVIDRDKYKMVGVLNKMQSLKSMITKMQSEIDFLSPLLERCIISIYQHDATELEDKSKRLSEKKDAYKEVIALDGALFLSLQNAADMFVEHFSQIRDEIQKEVDHENSLQR